MSRKQNDTERTARRERRRSRFGVQRMLIISLAVFTGSTAESMSVYYQSLRATEGTVTFKANWTANNYNITFVDEDGRLMCVGGSEGELEGPICWHPCHKK